MQSDGELLARVLEKKDFLQSVISDDASQDWALVRDLGEFLGRIEPDSEILGHALMARAYRHLSDLGRARSELAECRLRATNRELKPWEVEMLIPFLDKEENLLPRTPLDPEPDRT